MLEAFKALMTKRRETHALAAKASAAPLAQAAAAQVKPRLRVEPCPSFYLRTARAYAFLAAFLESAVGGGRPDDAPRPPRRRRAAPDLSSRAGLDARPVLWARPAQRRGHRHAI